MTPKEILIAAKAEIATPDRWEQRSWGSILTSEGDRKHVYVTDLVNHSVQPVCLCAHGALVWVACKDESGALLLLRQAMQAHPIYENVKEAYEGKYEHEELCGYDIPEDDDEFVHDFNDSEVVTHDIILQVFDKAIEAAS